MPYQALGFRSTTALLEAIPDVCSLQQRNGTLMVVGLPSSGTAHILTMVNRQGKKQVIITPDYHLITSFSSRGEVGESRAREERVGKLVDNLMEEVVVNKMVAFTANASADGVRACGNGMTFAVFPLSKSSF